MPPGKIPTKGLSIGKDVLLESLGEFLCLLVFSEIVNQQGFLRQESRLVHQSSFHSDRIILFEALAPIFF
jgi:hypothetical protein